MLLCNLTHTHPPPPTHRDRGIEDIGVCEEYDGILIGDGEDQLSEFPTAAMDSQRPYPFGLDPVSVAW